jgi:phage tail P2-like protein
MPRPLEHALAAAMARITAIPTPLTDLWRPGDPRLDPAWLAWSLSVDRWRPSWSEAQRRAATAAIPNAKIRGSRAAAEAVIADYDPRITLTEWWEEGGSGVPYTFFVTLPLDGLFDDRHGQLRRRTLPRPCPRQTRPRPFRAAPKVAQGTLPMAAVARACAWNAPWPRSSAPTPPTISTHHRIWRTARRADGAGWEYI